jgi:cholesterol transport system auxiliary component
MHHFILLLTSCLIISTLTGCVGINKTKQKTAVYDFGLSVSSESNQQITSKILSAEPVAAESLNHNKIRYRLNYQNPSRVFFYTDSRWAATPAELLSDNMSKMVNVD